MSDEETFLTFYQIKDKPGLYKCCESPSYLYVVGWESPNYEDDPFENKLYIDACTQIYLYKKGHRFIPYRFTKGCRLVDDMLFTRLENFELNISIALKTGS